MSFLACLADVEALQIATLHILGHEEGWRMVQTSAQKEHEVWMSHSGDQLNLMKHLFFCQNSKFILIVGVYPRIHDPTRLCDDFGPTPQAQVYGALQCCTENLVQLNLVRRDIPVSHFSGRPQFVEIVVEIRIVDFTRERLQHLHQCLMIVAYGLCKWSQPKSILDVRVCLHFHKPLDNVSLAMRGGNMERCSTIIVRSVYVDVGM
mmetsp:Transcript_62101/g.119680  ORF Transcript_62101/g.119680 Transcript_62101/m.119680 type:complete len:206 (-) Transcript_62101:529-1146(-)